MLLESDLVNIMEACIEGKLHSDLVQFSNESAMSVVLSTSGYPTGDECREVINGLDSITDPDVEVFQSRTWTDDRRNVRTSPNSRSLLVCAKAPTIKLARQKVYSSIGPDSVNFPGMHYRNI